MRDARNDFNARTYLVYMSRIIVKMQKNFLRQGIKLVCVSSRVEIPFVFTLLQSGLVHGLAFWFDVAYLGSK